MNEFDMMNQVNMAADQQRQIGQSRQQHDRAIADAVKSQLVEREDVHEKAAAAARQEPVFRESQTHNLDAMPSAFETEIPDVEPANSATWTPLDYGSEPEMPEMYEDEAPAESDETATDSPISHTLGTISFICALAGMLLCPFLFPLGGSLALASFFLAIMSLLLAKKVTFTNALYMISGIVAIGDAAFIFFFFSKFQF